jgi:hypothetical protein
VRPESVFVANDFASARFSSKRVPIAVRFLFSVVFLLACLACPRARADVGVVLNESLDSSVDKITGTGHSAVYFSRICPESPVKLRLCRPGELGSVMSNYINIGEDQPFEWNIVSLSMYLYGVEDPRDRAVFGSFKIKHLLEERYRTKYLATLCKGTPCTTSYKAEWREMVAATFIRSVYIFMVDTTIEQDRELIAEFNASPNQNHFNGVTNNCADFTRRVINSYFPHATNPNYINDFGMTSPKAIARSFTRYALRHPEANLRVLHFAQVPGTIKRSRECRAGTEQLYHSKKFLIPMIIFADHEMPAVVASYLLTGRFNSEHEFEKHPAAEKDAYHTKKIEAAAPNERSQVVGTSEEWKQYRKTLDAIVAEAVHGEIIASHGYLNSLFKHLDEAGTPLIDGDGALWLEIPANGETFRLGLSADNILAHGSDSQLAYELLLARSNRVLKSPKHSRETMSEFKQDWALLQSSRTRSGVSIASTAMPAARTRGTFMPATGDD